MLWFLAYDFLVVPVGWLLFQAFALVDQKIRRGVRGRKSLFNLLDEHVTRLEPDSCRVWFHSASMGEFEQAKPIIAEVKKRFPSARIIVTFFSPSGYEHSHSYRSADVISYLPYDSISNARRFVRTVRPTAVVLLRYDLWPNHLRALRESNVPVMVVSATLRNSVLRSAPIISRLFRFLYDLVDYILVVSDADREALRRLDVRNPRVEVIGDTRYDQVIRRSAESKSHRVIPPSILAGKKVFVIGSSWQEDEERLLPALSRLLDEIPTLLVILVPHEPTIRNLERIENELEPVAPAIRFSMLGEYRAERIIIIDSVGILMALYQYAQVAYVGGSFRQGIHNVLEPAVYGIPLVIGPMFENSQEAVQLVNQRAAFVASTADELYGRISMLLTDEHTRTSSGELGSRFVSKHAGATDRVLSYLGELLHHH